MESLIAKFLGLKSEPVAVLFSNDKPEGAAQFTRGSHGCAMFMFAAATRGKTAVFDRETFGCLGGGIGLGFGSQIDNYPGGLSGFCRFYSSGNACHPEGREIAEGMRTAGAPKAFVERFLRGERFKQSPELAEDFHDALPVTEVETTYVVLKPLSQVDLEKESPVSVTFLVNPNQLSALVTLANYDRPGLENVAILHTAACQVMGILSYREAKGEGRCLVGLTDLFARQYLNRQGTGDKMTFTVPYMRLRQMEACTRGSFLEGNTWQSILEKE